MGFEHEPVLLAEVLEALAVRPGGRYVDCTVGGGGHSEAIARRLGPDGRLLALDRDPAALRAAGERLQPYADRVRLVRTRFSRLAEVVAEAGLDGVDGVLFDLGVSSPQVDDPGRGFSYRHEAPLDMRMDPDAPVTAADLVARLPEEELARILREYGEERFAARIARRIVAERERRPIRTTLQLAELVREAIPAPARREPQHPARRTFQALRIAVNDELGELESALEAAVRVLRPGGRLVAIAFHSLEDRIVKQFIARLARGCECPPGTPVCICGKKPVLRPVGRQPRLPGPEEIRRNARARSARLRVAEKLGPEGVPV
ncbi:16S rRNA (cytosine(1402)-N(4))-methyltransferase RsmH [Caldinitratiruptor microaerophilus]|uniref:Ribosomal RNA small subunit methyltransferase H n=1 Tax=Caldinitratiruptor microaerophilus TaxID=671077 RepID=A0AA35CK28_9FIRM|nr:16S rRNA (cytosine(1402)-N(4))-methyltransferase RsmH [Caldinitratiruptor microaerophilus]BDG60764.1 ribosomal RNA small subunit methyltransferase H [Caldinitratiruptor microaerophilus]